MGDVKQGFSENIVTRRTQAATARGRTGDGVVPIQLEPKCPLKTTKIPRQQPEKKKSLYF